MRMGRLQIESQKAQIDIRTTRAKLNIEHARPVMRVKRTRAQMTIERQAPTFRRVRRRVTNRMITTRRLSRADIMPHVRNTIKNIAANAGESNKVHSLENNISMFPPGTDYSVGISARMDNNPTTGVDEIKWDPGYIRTSWTPAKLTIEWDIPRPKISVEPHSIEITLKRRHKLKISYIPPERAATQRKRVDKRV